MERCIQTAIAPERNTRDHGSVILSRHINCTSIYFQLFSSLSPVLEESDLPVVLARLAAAMVLIPAAVAPLRAAKVGRVRVALGRLVVGARNGEFGAATTV